jgi:hypothetical protein
MCQSCPPRPPLPRIARLGLLLTGLNDCLHRHRTERWERRSWRMVDRLAGAMYTWGER